MFYFLNLLTNKNQTVKAFSCPPDLARPTAAKSTHGTTSATDKPTTGASSTTSPPQTTASNTPTTTTTQTTSMPTNPVLATNATSTATHQQSTTPTTTTTATTPTTKLITPAKATDAPTAPTPQSTPPTTLKTVTMPTATPTSPAVETDTPSMTQTPQPTPPTTPTTITTPTATPTTPTLPSVVASTAPPPKTLPPTVITSCAVCAGPAFLCEKLFAPTPCPAPENYCINSVINHKDGTRTVDRKCGDFDTCYREWFQGSSDDDKCRKFDETEEQRLDFQCTYCCVTDDCNIPLRPDAESLYKPA